MKFIEISLLYMEKPISFVKNISDMGNKAPISGPHYRMRSATIEKSKIEQDELLYVGYIEGYNSAGSTSVVLVTKEMVLLDYVLIFVLKCSRNTNTSSWTTNG